MGLFKKKDKGDASPAPQSANPYAKAPMNPYQQAKNQAYNPSQGPEGGQGGTPPPPYSDNGRGGGGPGGYPQEKKNPYGGSGYAQQDRYGGGGGGGGGKGGYGSNPYGGQGGYGNDRYGGGNQQSGRDQGPPGGGSRYGAGGYGGMGGSDPYSQQDEGSRNALFGGAGGPPPPGKEGAPPQQNPYAAGAPPRNGPPSRNPYDPANPADGGFSSQGDYTPGPSYNDRQLTAEEEEEQDVQASKNEIRALKQQDVSSTRNALRMANRAEEVGRDTLARLGAQGEAIYNTEKHLDLASNHNKAAEEKARELKTLNRSMFAVHVSNPFTSKSRQQAADQAVIDRHVDERETREATRRAAYLTDQRMQKNFADIDKANAPESKRERNLAERAKYQFEADSEDEEMENEIDANLDALSGAAGRLNALAKATGREVDEQNKHLNNVAAKTDKVDIGLAANHARINRIK